MKKPVTKRPIEELTAGDGFRQSMLPKADHLDHSGVVSQFEICST